MGPLLEVKNMGHHLKKLKACLTGLALLSTVSLATADYRERFVSGKGFQKIQVETLESDRYYSSARFPKRGSSAFHPDAELTDRSFHAGEILGAPESKRVMPGNVSGDSSGVVRDRERAVAERDLHPLFGQVAVGMKAPRAVDAVVQEIDDRRQQLDVLSQHLDEETLLCACIDHRVGDRCHHIHMMPDLCPYSCRHGLDGACVRGRDV